MCVATSFYQRPTSRVYFFALFNLRNLLYLICDGVATFSFEDSRNFGDVFQQISLFDRPIDALQSELQRKYKGKQISVGTLCNSIDCDFSNHYVGKNVKAVLKRLETDGQLVVLSGRKQKMRKGELNMPDGAIVKFL